MPEPCIRSKVRPVTDDTGKTDTTFSATPSALSRKRHPTPEYPPPPTVKIAAPDRPGYQKQRGNTLSYTKIVSRGFVTVQRRRRTADLNARQYQARSSPMSTRSTSHMAASNKKESRPCEYLGTDISA